MSFVVKAAKKVFNGVKKIVKKTVSFAKRVVKSKYFKAAALVGLTLFTAGLGAAGWAGFSAQAFGSGVGGFFSAVGSTMAQGFSTIVGGLKTFGSGVKNFLTGQAGTGAAGAAGATPGTAGPTGLLSGISSGTAAPAATLGTSPLSAAAQVPFSGKALTGTGQTGFLGKLWGALTSPSIGGSMLRQGLAMGINGYMRSKEMDVERFYRNNRTVWGGAAFGGDSGGLDLLKPVGAGAPGLKPMGQEGSVAQQQAQQLGVTPPPALANKPQQGGLFGMVPAQANRNQPPQYPTGPAQTMQPPPATQPPLGRPPQGFRPELLGVT